MRTQAVNSEVVVLHLSQLIERIGDGRLHIPRFQRRLVWPWKKQRELLRSVRDGIPMGSVMIWRTDNTDVLVRSGLGGHALPTPMDNVPREYLLDGLQRLSTLFIALRGTNTSVDDEFDEGGARIGYDLREQEFVQLGLSRDQVDLFDLTGPGFLPLDVISSARTLLRTQRQWPDPEDAWLERSDELARAFREYQVPVVTIVSGDLELAVRTFKMINSQGSRMGEVDMVHALAWSAGLQLRERLETSIAQHLAPLGWGEIAHEDVLRVVKADANIDLYDRSAEAVSRQLEREPKRLDAAVRRLAQTAKLLAKIGLRSTKLVPYRVQPVIIAAALDGVEDLTSVEESIVDWFWLTTFGEMFAGVSGRRMTITIDELRETMKDGVVRWSGAKPFQRRSLPTSSDFKSVRVKALALCLALAHEGFAGPGSDIVDTLSAYGSEAFTKLLMPPQASQASCSSPGNRFVCPPSGLPELRTQILDGHIDPSLAQVHLIPAEAITASEHGDWDGFVAARLDYLQEKEQAFADRLKAKHLRAKPHNTGGPRPHHPRG